MFTAMGNHTWPMALGHALRWQLESLRVRRKSKVATGGFPPLSWRRYDDTAWRRPQEVETKTRFPGSTTSAFHGRKYKQAQAAEESSGEETTVSLRSRSLASRFCVSKALPAERNRESAFIVTSAEGNCESEFPASSAERTLKTSSGRCRESETT